MRKTEPWWVCSLCGERIKKVGKKGLMKAIEKHKKSCGPLTSVYIVQVEQRKKKRSSGREADCVTLEGEGPKGSAGSNPACSS